ncbi:MAG TPA: acetyl-CoA C-acetyltransferase [Steroidobacteraceae bacterium]|nr:acetyl-CoA C-acetyltransferase [Steroidobacteraceae bacterium]
MTEAFIYDHVRTPRGRGRPDGALHEITPAQLAAQMLGAIRDRNDLDTSEIEDVVLGCVSPVGEQGGNIARIAALVAGYATTVPGYQLNRFCASGLDALNNMAARIMSGQASAGMAGGVESMSRVPMGSDGGSWYFDPRVNHMTTYVPQGIGADFMATQDGHTREDLDRLALQSHRRAARAWDEGRFARSVVPVRDVADDVLLERDENVRANASLEGLAGLKPAFEHIGEALGYDALMAQRYPDAPRIRHEHTAGNSSAVVDGACVMLVGDSAFGQRANLRPRARIRAFASIGSDPTIMLTGIVPVTEKLLRRAGMALDDVDLFEVNEAFAAVVMRFMRHFELPADRVNVNGGSIALGHPLGATGVMLVGTALDELERRGLGTALITLCAGAGMASATLIERV